MRSLALIRLGSVLEIDFRFNPHSCRLAPGSPATHPDRPPTAATKNTDAGWKFRCTSQLSIAAGFEPSPTCRLREAAQADRHSLPSALKYTMDGISLQEWRFSLFSDRQTAVGWVGELAGPCCKGIVSSAPGRRLYSLDGFQFAAVPGWLGSIAGLSWKKWGQQPRTIEIYESSGGSMGAGRPGALQSSPRKSPEYSSAQSS